jgi:hypothetical protein
MGKKYIPKRLKTDKLRLQNCKDAETIDYNEPTPTQKLATPTSKKLQISHARLRNRSTSMTGFAVEDEDEDFPPVDNDEYNPDEIHYDNVNIIISMKVILNLVNRLCCPSCRRVGKMSQEVTQRRGLLYHITFSCTCSFQTSIKNSKPLVHSDTARMDELNMMACAAANVGGIKRTGMTVMLGMLNILPPVQIESWQKYQKLYANGLSVVKDECLEMAGKILFLISSSK